MDETYRLHELTVEKPGAPLYAALADAVPGLGRRKARMAVAAGLVHIDGSLALDANAALGERARLRVDLRQGIPAKGALRHRGEAGTPAANERPFTVLYEDEQVLVLDKAAGVLAAPTRSGSHGHVLELLRHARRRREQRSDFLGQVHRIDAATSGCLLVALDQQAQRILSAQFASHAAQRRYRCLVAGNPRQDQDTLTGRIGRGADGRRCVVRDGRPGKEAVTHFRVLRRWERGSELECQLETGRTHQIRVHLAGIGCPVLGDPIYGRGVAGLRPPRLMLHAWQVTFDHPRGGKRVTVEAPLPTIFDEVAAQLGPER